MAKQVAKWACELCGKEYEEKLKAEACEAQHSFTEIDMEPYKPYPQRIMVSLNYPTKDVNAVYELKFIASVEPEYPPVVIDDLKLFRTLLDVKNLFAFSDDDWRETSVLYVESGIYKRTVGGILTEKRVIESNQVFGLFEKNGAYFTLSYVLPKDGSPLHHVQNNQIERIFISLEGELQKIEEGKSGAVHTEKYREVLEKQIAILEKYGIRGV